MVTIAVEEVERRLDELFIAAEGASLRKEDRRKAIEIAALLSEVAMAIDRLSKRSPITLVDAAAGKSYLGLLAAKLILEPLQRQSKVITIERDPRRAALSRRAADAIKTTVPIVCHTADVEEEDCWPARPVIVAGLHACGAASDEIISQAIAHNARFLLLVPCCTGKSVAASSRAAEAAKRLAIPRHAPVRRRFIQAWVDAERTWRLEAAGYQTEVVEFVSPTVTPHNLLWRARLVSEPQRTRSAARELARMLQSLE